MSRAAAVSLFVASFLVPLVAAGADITGTLLYDNLLVTGVFPDITATRATANPWDPGGEIEGTVDLATCTYSISGLETGEYAILVYLERTGSPSNVGNAGDLQAYVNFEVTDAGASYVQNLDVQVNYHVISPVNSDLPLDGEGHDCTAYPAVEYPITLTIEPVPRAVDYLFTANLSACPGGSLDWLDLPSAEPSVSVEWGTAGEDYQNLWVSCVGASGKELCHTPTFHYTDAHVWALLLRNGSSPERGRHHSNAVVIPAVAGTPGSQGTYWTSAVTIVNLSSSDRTLELTYTPRGRDGLHDYTDATVAIPASSQLAWSDVVDELFHTTGAGALEIRGSQLAVTSRTSTPGTDAGSYGQGIPPLQPEQLLSTDGTDTAAIGGVEHGPAFRTNLGLCEIWGESATVRISILDAKMTELGYRDQALRAYENVQINDVVEEVAGVDTLENGIARVAVTAGDGRVGAYLSVVDNAIGDPTFITIAPQTPAGAGTD